MNVRTMPCEIRLEAISLLAAEPGPNDEEAAEENRKA